MSPIAKDAVSPLSTGLATVSAPAASKLPAEDASNKHQYVRFAADSQSPVAAGKVSALALVTTDGSALVAAFHAAAAAATRAYEPDDGSVTLPPASVGVVLDNAT